MPCYTPPHERCEHDSDKIANLECSTIDAIKTVAATMRYYEKKSDEAIAFLCEVLTKIDESMVDIGLSEKLHGWWKEHKQFDSDRKNGGKNERLY